MEDILIKGVAADGQLKFMAASTAILVEEARVIHGLSPVATAAFGRLLTGALLMSADLKNPADAINIYVNGDGQIGKMLAVSGSDCKVRGYVQNPVVDFNLNDKGKLDVSKAVGNGTLRVIKEMGLKNPYLGEVEIISGEIAEDLTWYYAKSEQVPSSVALGVQVDTSYRVSFAGGFVVQVMPGAEEGTVSALEELIGGFPPVTFLYEEGFTTVQIMDMLLNRLGYRVLDTKVPSYYCPCSKERMEKNLLALGKKELLELSEEKEGIQLECHFCNMKYKFNKEEIKNLLIKT